MTVTGPEFPGGAVFPVPAAGLFLNGITEGHYTIVEQTGNGYTVIGVNTDDNAPVYVGGASSTSVDLTHNDIDTVTFYNRPNGSINAQKVAVTSANGGADQAAPNDDDGWIITVKSVECSYELSKPTDANGFASFTNLEICDDYVVSENPNNPSSPDFVPASPISVNGQTPVGQTITFLNRKSTTTPPCSVGCGNTVPTPTPTTADFDANRHANLHAYAGFDRPGREDPGPTEKPSETAVAGEKTPGPGNPTPVAPSTGNGLMGGTAAGMNLLLLLGGMLALASGLSFVAMGRKSRS